MKENRIRHNFNEDFNFEDDEMNSSSSTSSSSTTDLTTFSSLDNEMTSRHRRRWIKMIRDRERERERDSAGDDEISISETEKRTDRIFIIKQRRRIRLENEIGTETEIEAETEIGHETTKSVKTNSLDEATERRRQRRRWINKDGWLHNGWTSNISFFKSSNSSSFRETFDWPIFVFILTLVFSVADACSTRPSPKPRPPRPIWSPDLGYGVVKENCTDDYAELYCMNSGKCYRQKILETFIVNCECQPGFVGTRCQYRDVPDKYLPVQQRVETASIAGGVTVLVVIVTVFSILLWLYYRRRRHFKSVENSRLPTSIGHV